MSQEKICSIILELPKVKQDYLKQKTGEVCKDYDLRRKNNLHLSIKPSFRCRSEGFREALDDLLKMQSPFEIELNKIALFENSKEKLGLVYLTTDNEEQIERLNGLYNSIGKIINSKAKGGHFTPHVSLIDWAPINEIIDAGEYLKRRLTPVKMSVSELALKKKTVTDNHWKEDGRFNLGGDDFGVELFRSRLNEMLVARG